MDIRALLLLVGLGSLPVMATADVPPPQAVVVISCRVDDLGLDNLPAGVIPDVPTWRNLQWHVEGGELECKRTVVELVDQVALVAPETPELHPNFSNYAQCAAVAMQMRAPEGWAVMAVGCPVPIKDDMGTPSDTDDKIIGWKMPDCPSWVKCRFNEDAI